MPIYEYLCEQCGRRSEAIQRLGDAPLTECPDCGGSLKKMFSAPSFQLEGQRLVQDRLRRARRQAGSEREAGR